MITFSTNNPLLCSRKMDSFIAQLKSVIRNFTAKLDLLNRSSVAICSCFITTTYIYIIWKSWLKLKNFFYLKRVNSALKKFFKIICWFQWFVRLNLLFFLLTCLDLKARKSYVNGKHKHGEFGTTNKISSWSTATPKSTIVIIKQVITVKSIIISAWYEVKLYLKSAAAN